MSLRLIHIVGESTEKQGAGRVSGTASGKSVSAQAIVVTDGVQLGDRRDASVDRLSMGRFPDIMRAPSVDFDQFSYENTWHLAVLLEGVG